MKKSYAIALGVSASCLVLFWLWSYLSKPSPESLAHRALTAKELKERVHAAVNLSMLKSPDPIPQLRRLLKDSKDPEVLAQALNALAFRMDSETVPQFIAALDHETPKVRQAAYAGVLRFNGGALPEDLEYSPEAPADERAHVVHRLKEIHDKRAQPVAIVAANIDASVKATPPTVEPATKEPATKEPATKEPSTKEPPTKEPAGKESPPPTTAPAPVYNPPPTPFTPVEYPAITLLIWMLQIIAVLVLIFDVAGAISLTIGEKGAKQTPAADKKEAPVAVPVEKNSATLWIKIALLVAGAVCIVALLTAAEMVRLAVRMEQKMDYMSRMR